MKKIIIPFDYSENLNLLSYIEVLDAIKEGKELIITGCLSFFSFDILDYDYDVKVQKKNDDYIILSELLDNNGSYTNKEIRKAHNVFKMLLAESFEFKKI